MKIEKYKMKIGGKRWRKPVAIIIAVAILASLASIFAFRQPPSAQAAWYNSDYNWQYRQKFQISSGTALTDYQVVLNSASLDFSHIFAHTQEAGADLRFTTSDQVTNIPYWIETYSASGLSAKIWLKVPSVASGTTDIYAYYGNAGASAASSGVNTFIMFDDFSNLSSWTQSGSTISVSDGVVTLDSGTNPNIYRDFSATQPFTAEVKYQRPSAYRNRLYLTTTSTTLSPTGYDYGDFGQLYWNGFTGVSLANNTWYTVRWDATSSNYTWKILNSSGTEVFSRSHGSSISNLGRISLGGTESASSDLKFDWARVRKYSATEPTVALSGSNEQADTVAPANPSTVIAKSASDGAVLSAATIYNYTNPYFDWPAVDAAGGASDTGANIDSGVAGYYSYFGTSCGEGGANPAITKGDYLSEVGGVAVHYSADTDVTVATAITTPGTYCLRMKTKDNAGNTQSTVWEPFSYQFENVAPSAPAYIAASPSGYTATDSFSFSWPATSDGASSPQSGLAGYQYKRGSGSGDSWSSAQVGTSVSSVQKYQNGVNVFLVRAIDIAGNTSDEVQTNFYYTADAPTEPGSLAVSPESSSDNSFSFSWIAPVHGADIINYGFSVNAWPTAQNITWTGSAGVSLAAGAYATQQGTNILYLVAKDEAGNYALDDANVAQVSFSCDSAAPPAPVSVAVTDSSNRAANIWSLSLKWTAGTGQNPSSFDHYSIFRSIDNVTFSELATTSGTSYADTSSLSSDTTYYYYIKSVDNADQASVASTTVSRKPTGKYLTPPTFVSVEPTVTTKAGEATIGWVTDRNSSSMVRFGTVQNNLDNSQGQLDSVTDHSVTVKGLKSSTTYYYQVQSLDEMRDYSSDLGYSATFSFATTGLPSIANVNVSNITLTSADISWETTAATNHTVSYGTSISYDKTLSGDSGSYVTNHSTKLEDLTHSTTYHFKISGADQDSNQVNSDDYVFETQKMPEISFISYAQGNDGPMPIITVEWKTNVPTTSSISYHPKDGSVKDASEQSESALVDAHKIILQGLNDGTEYTFSVSGRDQFGNLAESSKNTLKTNDDKRPPKIEGVVYEVSNVGSSAKVFVYWKTDEPSTSQVEYGKGIMGDQFTVNTVEDTLLASNHLVIVTNVEGQKPLYMRACSKDKAGNKACSDASTVIPGEAKKSPLQILLDAIIKKFRWAKALVGL